jgi:hypothetical protein
MLKVRIKIKDRNKTEMSERIKKNACMRTTCSPVTVCYETLHTLVVAKIGRDDCRTLKSSRLS